MSLLFYSVLSGRIADPPKKSLLADRNEHVALSKSALPSTMKRGAGSFPSFLLDRRTAGRAFFLRGRFYREFEPVGK
jgi:hypothetical protein